MTIAQATKGTSCTDKSCFFTFSCAMMVTPEEPRNTFPPVWSKCQCVFTSRVTGRSAALKIASLSSVARESTPLSISNVLPSSTIAVTFPPSPENMNKPLPREVTFRGLFSNLLDHSLACTRLSRNRDDCSCCYQDQDNGLNRSECKP